MDTPCSVCGEAGEETLVFADCGSEVDLTGEIGVFNAYSVSAHVDLCRRPECHAKAEERLRGAKRPKHTVRT